jgi:hypothetical protein
MVVFVQIISMHLIRSLHEAHVSAMAATLVLPRLNGLLKQVVVPTRLTEPDPREKCRLFVLTANVLDSTRDKSTITVWTVTPISKSSKMR